MNINKSGFDTLFCKNVNVGEPVPKIKVTKDFTGFLQVPRLKTRVPSYRVRELVRGQFIVKLKDITLLECIGQGIYILT